MRKSSFNSVQLSCCATALLMAIFSGAAFSADSPIDVVKKLISDKPDKTASADTEKPKDVKPSSPSALGDFYSISSYDGSLRMGRCNGSLGSGIFLVPTNVLGGRISEGLVMFSGKRYPVTAFYSDDDSGMTVLFTSAKTKPSRQLAKGLFPEPPARVLLNALSAVDGEVRDIYGLGQLKAVQISGEVDEENFVGYEVCDTRGRIIGVVLSCEWVYDKNNRADICYVLPSTGVSYIAEKALREKTPLAAPAKSILAAITPAEFNSYSQARYMLFMRRYPQAIKLLRKLLHSAPINAYAYRQLADMYFEQRDFQKAADCYHKAIELQPAMLACYPRMAQAMGRTDQPTMALDILVKCEKNIKGEEMKQTFAESFRLIGIDLLKADQPAKAVIALQNADRLRPGNSEIFFTLAEALMDADQLPQARIYYGKFLKLVGPVWREYTLSSPSGGDVVMDPRALRAERRIDEIDYKIRMRKTAK